MSAQIRYGIFSIIAAAGIVGASLALGGEDGWLYAARYTARFSFHLFLFIFAAEAIFRWSDSAKRSGAIAFGAAHYVHLFALAVFNISEGLPPQWVNLIGGGFFYAMLGILVIASTFQKSWPRFRMFTFALALLFFTLAYAKRIPHEETALIGTYGVALVTCAITCKVIATYTNRGQVNRLKQA